MAQKQKRFERPLGERRYKTLFVIATDGAETERRYFQMFNGRNAVVHVECIVADNPVDALKRMRGYLKKEELKATDEAWLVVDKDRWTDEQLRQLYSWSREQKNHGLALSNPKFEYWLLLHFEDGDDIATSRECSERLARHLPAYAKSNLDLRTFGAEKISRAIERARGKDHPPCEDWPRKTGTTVYRLVEKILKTSEAK